MLTGYIKPGNASKQEAMYTKESLEKMNRRRLLLYQPTGTRSAVTIGRDTTGSREL